MKKTILAVLIAVLVTTPCFAQETSTLSTELQEALDRAREELDIIGVSAAIITPDEGLWLGVSGLSDKRPLKSMEPEMLFHIGSVTKTFIAALVLQLIEEDILNFDDTVGEWLTDLPRESYPWLDNTVTIRQLLKHRTGFSDPMGRDPNLKWVASILLTPYKIWEPEEILSVVQEPFFLPGEGYQYSNTNFILLGMIIEKATNSNVAAELRERFFDPLGLENTFLNIAEPVYGELAHMHLIGSSRGLADITWLPRNSLDSSGWTASGMLSTAEDLALWAQSLFGGSVLSEDSLGRMLDFTEPDLTYPDVPRQWGMGLFGYEDSQFGERWEMTGLWPCYRSLMDYLPEHDVVIVLLINQYDFSSTELWNLADGLLDVAIK